MTETLPWPIQAAAEWMPLWKGAGFFLATFILEDAAAVGAGLLLAAGGMSWPMAFASCFLGIWLGDAGLYALARFGGRKWFEKSSLQKHAGRVARAESWFARRGTWMLIFSRCVPGTRLPTYLAAGFLRRPLPDFLAVTGAAAVVWTIFILWLAQSLGASLVHYLAAGKHATWYLLAAGALLLAVFQGLRWLVAHFQPGRFSARLARWSHWEFWPGWMFYPPVVFYCLWLAIKYRGLNVPTVANPGIFTGGIVGESKMEILNDLSATSPQFTAEAALVKGDTFAARLESFERQRARLRLAYPFIMKPDVGQRGTGVKLVRDQAQSETYLRQCAAAVIIQRYAPGPFEAGIFYYRFPQEPHGRIFSITEKVFPSITGDGVHTIGQLIGKDARARLIERTYRRRFASRWEEVLPAGGTLRLVEAGNHAQGCIFRDGMHLNSPQLVACIDDISRQLSGFFIGRFDIRYASEAELRAGNNFQIVELNGAAAEAASIYDSRNSLWSAYRTLFRQWELVFAIGAANRDRGHVPTKTRQVWRAWREHARTALEYPLAD